MFGSVFFPFVFSFERNVGYYKQWKALGIAIVIPGLFFIVWDALFTKLGFWSFNDQFILGPRLLGLPLEEWLFFVVIPFCSVFYSWLITWLNKQINSGAFLLILCYETALNRLFWCLILLSLVKYITCCDGKYTYFKNRSANGPNVCYLITNCSVGYKVAHDKAWHYAIK